MALVAYVDESCRIRHGDSSVYALAAVILDELQIDVVTAVMEAMKFGKSPRVHWRDEQPARQRLLVRRVALLPISGIVTVCLHSRSMRSERARRLCLETLLTELELQGVHSVVVESRHAQDRDDLQLVHALRRSGRLGRGTKIFHQRPLDSPALWAADVVAGAFTAWMDGSAEYWEMLDQIVGVIEVDERR